MTSTILRVPLKGEGSTSTPVSKKSRAKLFRRLGVDPGIAHGQVVQRPVLIRRPRVIRHLQDAIEHLRVSLQTAFPSSSPDGGWL